MHKNKILVTVAVLISALLFINSCAINPPVQEMSDARQALSAAKDAQAEKYAKESYDKAKSLLEEARSYLEDGDFFSAQSLAIEAKLEATAARQSSQNHTKDSK